MSGNSNSRQAGWACNSKVDVVTATFSDVGDDAEDNDDDCIVFIPQQGVAQGVAQGAAPHGAPHGAPQDGPQGVKKKKTEALRWTCICTTVNPGECKICAFCDSPCPPRFSPSHDDSSRRSSTTLVLLVGLPGSGKSTFTQAILTSQTRSPFTAINQDELGTRKKCEALTRSALGRGESVIIDRTNISVQQRLTWTRLAKEFGSAVDVVYFQVDQATCAKRCDTREDHPTVKRGQGKMVVNMMKKAHQPPNARKEGFRNIFNVSGGHAVDSTAFGYILGL